MAKPFKRPDHRKARVRKRLMFVGLALFVVVDVLLVGLALNPYSREATTAVRVPTATSTPTLEPTAEPTPPAAAIIASPVPNRIIAAADTDRAWRATTGECGAPAAPEVTTDAGSTWNATDATEPTGVVSLQSIAIEGTQVVSAIGQDSVTCDATLIRTFVSGADYAEYADELARFWFVDPLNRATVHSPAGTATAPCATVVTLATQADERAAVLCSDGSLFTTVDSAASWNAIDVASGTMSIATMGEGYSLATIGDDTCAGIRVGFFTEPAANTVGPVSPLGCVASAQTPDALAGQIALAEGTGTLWLWAGDVLTRSTDGGATWG